MQDNELAADFDTLPPEMVTVILEYLEDSPTTVLACRLVSHRFKLLIDDILEKRQVSLWSWRKCTGEAKAVSVPGPLKRRSPTGRHFQRVSEIDEFLTDMKNHKEHDLNPFPNRGIYFRRVRENALLSMDPNVENAAVNDDSTLQEIRMRSFRFFEQDSTGDSEPLSVSKILTLLDTFGEYLTSLIFEGGATTYLVSIGILRDILQKVPNLQCLLLKGIHIKKNPVDSELELPPLEHLKSVKIIYSTGVTTHLLRSYHSQLETLQLINSRDFWRLHFELLHVENHGDRIFGTCRELKIGELSNPKEIEYLQQFLLAVQENPQSRSLHRLERLSIRYLRFQNFEEHVGKLFQLLEHLPMLIHFDIGKCGDGIGVDDTVSDQDNRSVHEGIKFISSSPALTRISLPSSLLQSPRLLRSIFLKIRTLQYVRFYSFSSPTETTSEENEEASESPLMKDTSMVMAGWMEEFPYLRSFSLVNWFGDRERVVLVKTRCVQNK